MQPFTTHSGKVVAMDRSNVDTDQIIPKQFLKRIERTGFGQFLFNDWRFDTEGNEIETFELNRPESKGATILLSRQNFGCGSSREHAVWALADYGFRCVIAESFADIFFNNCFKNGVLPITLGAQEIDELFNLASRGPLALQIDLAAQRIKSDSGFECKFEIDSFRKDCLLDGLDDIALTLQQEEKITAFEAKHEKHWTA
jgi:3-isopropylmalate/(R)-2-methylmalate dehydratase small subunit